MPKSATKLQRYDVQTDEMVPLTQDAYDLVFTRATQYAALREAMEMLVNFHKVVVQSEAKIFGPIALLKETAAHFEDTWRKANEANKDDWRGKT